MRNYSGALRDVEYVSTGYRQQKQVCHCSPNAVRFVSRGLLSAAEMHYVLSCGRFNAAHLPIVVAALTVANLLGTYTAAVLRLGVMACMSLINMILK